MVKKTVEEKISKLEGELADLKKEVQGTPESHVVVLLDRSGSMNSCRSSTVTGFNEYINGLKADTANKFRITLAEFDSIGAGLSDKLDFHVVREYQDLDQVAELTLDEFVPRGGTPLYDAVGRAVTFAETVEKSGNPTILVIFTDGGENSSRKYSQEEIKTILDAKQDNHGWVVTYMGANQDAWAVGQSIGVNNAFQYNTFSTGANFASAAAMTSASATARSMGFSRGDTEVLLKSTRTTTYKEEDTDLTKGSKS